MLPLALPHLPFLLLTPPPSSSILIPLVTLLTSQVTTYLLGY